MIVIITGIFGILTGLMIAFMLLILVGKEEKKKDDVFRDNHKQQATASGRIRSVTPIG